MFREKTPSLHTYSIVGYDPESKSWGVAVASKFLAVGAYVPYAQAGAGAIATQAEGNPIFGTQGLALLQEGKTAQETLEILLAHDDKPKNRQIGIVDKYGKSATYTGDQCFSWAGGLAEGNIAIQGNTLPGEQVILAIKNAFVTAKGSLAHRLYAALNAGEKAGGEKRGKQAASLLVVKEKGGYGGRNDRFLDLRVDDHQAPLEELGRLLGLHDLFLGSTPPEEKIKIDTSLARELQEMMKQHGEYSGEITGAWDKKTQTAFYDFAGYENLEERIDAEKGTIDPPALTYLHEKFGKAGK